jgi:hypothetical protein
MAGTSFSTGNWTGYDEFTLTNPGSALTDFTLLLDISKMSNDWAGEVQADGADIRCTKGDDTELPYDLIDWDYNGGDPTGWLRISWDGTLASSGTQKVRVWVCYTGGSATAYDANEEYGSDNAYDGNWEAYWPLDEASGTLYDRTSNSHDGTAQNTPTYQATGKVGYGMDFDKGSTEYVDCGAIDMSGLSGLSVLFWAKYDGASDADTAMGNWDGANAAILIRTEASNGDYKVQAFVRYNGGNVNVDFDALFTNALHHYAVRYDATGGMNLVYDGNDDARTGPAQGNLDPDPSGTNFALAERLGSSDPWDGILDDVQIHSTYRSDEWVDEEYAQSNDQDSFWSAGGWTAVSGGFDSKKAGVITGCLGYVIGA